jgi:putative addiction module antidote
LRTTRLTKVGNSTGVTIPRDVLAEMGLALGDVVSVSVREGRIEVARADETYDQAMKAGRAVAARYRRSMAALAK